MIKTCSAIVFCLILAGISSSCSNNKISKDPTAGGNMIQQQDDGSYFLKLEDAACYVDQTDPSGNTAEWKFRVPGPGRYKVWISSATIDTMNLRYSNPVKVSLLDNQLVKSPECDRIIRNSDDVSHPYYRTDSYMGSFYFPEQGEYNIQVISEKVTKINMTSQNNTVEENTKLVSLILTPATR